MTLKDLIESDAENVVLNTDDFAVDVLHYVYSGGSYSSTTIAGIIFLDDEAQFQGFAVDDDQGRREVRHAVLEIAASVTVATAATQETADYFTIDGERWNAIRHEGRDNGMQAIVLRRDEKVSTKRAKVKP